LGTAVTLLFLPHLTLTAHQGYAALKSAAAPLGPVLVGVLRVVLVQGCRQELDPPGLPGGEASVPMPGNDLPWWLEGLMKMAGYGLVGLGGVCLCVLMGLGLWMVLRWLVSRSEKRASVGRPKGWFRAWLVRTGVFFLLAWQKMISGRKNSRGPVQLYASLLIWGKRSGFPRLGSETPSEYALRLGPCFPSLRGEIRLIVQTFNESVYGERTHDTDQLMSARGALLHLFSPIHWPSRLRSWFMHPHRGQERL
jgi:hypothetical protein